MKKIIILLSFVLFFYGNARSQTACEFGELCGKSIVIYGISNSNNPDLNGLPWNRKIYISQNRIFIEIGTGQSARGTVCSPTGTTTTVNCSPNSRTCSDRAPSPSGTTASTTVCAARDQN